MLQKLVSHVDGDVEIRIQVTRAALTNSTHLYCFPSSTRPSFLANGKIIVRY